MNVSKDKRRAFCTFRDAQKYLKKVFDKCSWIWYSIKAVAEEHGGRTEKRLEKNEKSS